MRRAREVNTVFKRFSGYLLPALLGLSLTACSMSPLDIRPDSPLASAARDPNFIVSVDLAPGDTIDAVAQRYGGDVLVWQPGDYALVGLDSEPVEGDLAYGLPLDPNSRDFIAGGSIAINHEGASTIWAGGTSTIWAGGASTIWAGGASTLWAGGSFSLLPENTGTWLQVGLDHAHELAGQLGRGVKVAIIDTGIDLEHPTFREALAQRREWWDFVDNDAVPQEEGVFGEGGHGHGSNVAAIVRQVAPRATILPIRVLDSDGKGDVADLAAAIDWAVAMGADVINLSLGADKRVNAVDKAIRRAAADGVFVVTSAGNDGAETATYPASASDTGIPRQARRMVSVTSVDELDVKSDFANFDKSLELAAPGERVYGPVPGDVRVTAAWSGTSMAAPIASGALALALGEPLAVDPAKLAEWLMETSDAGIYEISGNEEYSKQKQLGEGRLDVHRFLLEVLADPSGG
jgi:thermitase